MPNYTVSRAVLRAAMVEFGTKAGRCTVLTCAAC